MTTGTLAWPVLKAKLGWGADAPAPSYRVGEQIDLPSSLYSGNNRTVLLFTSPSCAACQRSKVPAAALVHELRAMPGTAVVMVAPPAGGDQRLPFARELGIQDSNVIVHAGTLRLQRIPAVVVVDRTGKVLLIREGMLTELDRKDVVESAGDSGPPRVLNPS